LQQQAELASSKRRHLPAPGSWRIGKQGRVLGDQAEVKGLVQDSVQQLVSLKQAVSGKSAPDEVLIGRLDQ
jgi:hypothetical protein